MFVKEEIENKIEELGAMQPWNHSIELPYGINTAAQNQVSHGKNLIKWSRIEKYIDQFDIKDKRILDIGCNEGFFSLKMAEHGVREVVGIDADRFRIEKAQFVSDVLQISNIHYEVVDIFDVVAIGAAWDTTPSDSQWNSRADLNGDNIIDIFDLTIVGRNYGLFS